MIERGGAELRNRELAKLQAQRLHQLYYGYWGRPDPHQFDWIRPRRTWLEATCPVDIDFGNDWLAKLEIYDESGLPVSGEFPWRQVL